MIRQSIESFGNNGSRYGPVGGSGNSKGPLVSQDGMEGYPNQNLMMTDRDQSIEDGEGKRTQMGLKVNSLNSSQVQVPCNTKQYNTVNQSMDCKNSQSGFYKGTAAHQPVGKQPS